MPARVWISPQNYFTPNFTGQSRPEEQNFTCFFTQGALWPIADTVSEPALRWSRLLLDALLALIGRLQVFAGLFLSALRIVFGADRQVVFVDRALSLPGDIEDLA
jgi:hypothetical protein